MRVEGKSTRDRCFIRFVLCFDFFPSTSEGRNVGAAASRKDREVEVAKRGMSERERERERRSHLESERYLHVICILVDPYCFHFQPIHRGDIPAQTSLSYFPFSSYFLSPSILISRSLHPQDSLTRSTLYPFFVVCFASCFLSMTLQTLVCS